MEINSDEKFVIIKMREIKGHAKFSIDKRPSKKYPDGRLVRIVSEKSDLVIEGIAIKN